MSKNRPSQNITMDAQTWILVKEFAEAKELINKKTGNPNVSLAVETLIMEAINNRA